MTIIGFGAQLYCNYKMEPGSYAGLHTPKPQLHSLRYLITLLESFSRKTLVETIDSKGFFESFTQ